MSLTPLPIEATRSTAGSTHGVCLATAAQVTHRALIGPLVTSIIFRNPASVVSAAASIQAASKGRLELALGAGEPGAEVVAQFVRPEI